MASDTVPYSPAPVAKKTAKHYGPTVVAQGLILGIGILTGVLTARLLGPQGRGEYAAVFVWTTGIAALVGLGINQAIAFHQGKRSFTPSELCTAATAIWTIQSVLSIVVCILVLHFVLAGYSPLVRHVAVLFAFFTPALIGGGNPQALFQGSQDLVKFNFLRSLSPSVYCAALLALFVVQWRSLEAVFGSLAFSYVLAAVVGCAMAWRAFRPRWKWNRAAIGSLLHFGTRVQTTNLTSYFNQRIDQVILSLFVPPQQLGFYAVAVSLSTAVAVFPQAAGIVTFSKGSNQNRDDAGATIGTAFRASLIWLLLSCGGLYVMAHFLIRHVFGVAFDGSILACRILIPGAFMTGLNQVLYNGASALGRPGLPSIAEGLSMLVTAIGLFLLVPHYGYIGAAIVSSIAYTASFVVMLILAHRYLALNLRLLLFPSLAGASLEHPNDR